MGALLGAVDTARCEEGYKRSIRPRLIRRCLKGAYGWPGWLLPVLRTEWAARLTRYPDIDVDAYPAHLHIGVLPAWRRQGIGTLQSAPCAAPSAPINGKTKALPQARDAQQNATACVLASDL